MESRSQVRRRGADTVAAVDDLFAPPGPEWRRISPRLATIRRLVLSAAAVLTAVVLLILWRMDALSGRSVLLLEVLLLAVFGWAWWLVGRNAAHWGYAEEDDELHITSGAYFRRLVVVPYGRMQYVDVQSGPLDQLYGIAKLQLHTASPGTSATIPGLPAEEAARLRDRLTALGETQAAGL
ncbi:MAG: transmembrane protein, distant homology with ydbS [uncultured Nocardioidaceae bacterium]|uniref:Transmembrane protein, distant homology with ydbS n=1 Tax=uncultured Nocardioidaceae bacterium TaxID=253824 RepID=A0A6J4MG14_9ACTN|nr:MAG: transmembrane protein, distant homology with ydbS [uncultured Nocardioidaceae bacterium]